MAIRVDTAKVDTASKDSAKVDTASKDSARVDTVSKDSAVRADTVSKVDTDKDTATRIFK
ncbi:uncharacterized protein Dwil_GK18300 [Drosophila willistoni]|uniref:Uncharacterized protein n=1 Tax=Drosophila willistoni TaxID=7260 RepID=B4MZ59_DROWI|nr:uncharacterized protein Dwil_GK18300 [Drosophila willistoni]